MDGLWIEVEEKCEGKIIANLSANDSGMIIQFTDGSKLTFVNGILFLEENHGNGKN